MNTKKEKSLPDANREIPTNIPVLIVGGGPVGLSASLLLSYNGIRSLLVEKHPGTSTYPKARFINARTMEIFRQLGIEQAMRETEITHAANFIMARSLAGEELLRISFNGTKPGILEEWSPTSASTSSQEIIEQALLVQARHLSPAQIRFDTQLASIEQGDEDVLATLVHRPSGRVQHVHAQYLIGADGAHSTVREALGIRMLGNPALANMMNIHFKADLSRWVADREISICYVKNPDVVGNLYYYGGKRWKYQTFYYPERGQRPEDFTSERCLQLIRTAVGVPELEVELGEIIPWTPAEQIAEHFYQQRVFLAGDAAHLMSPTGGFGMNSGIQDVHNLGWKLAAVLNGWAPQALLSSYETERLPVARVLVEQMAHNLNAVPGAPGIKDTSSTDSSTQRQTMLGNMFGANNLVFGMSYDSAAIVPDGTAQAWVANPITDYVPSARPGNRAAHIWLDRSGERLSTLDLFGRKFVFLSGSQGSAWCEAAKTVSGSMGVPIQAYRIGTEGDLTDPGQTWALTYGVEPDGAVLVRPDGFVAWRAARMKAEPGQEIKQALLAVLVSQPSQQLQTTQ